MSTVVLKVGGVDITPIVIFEDASFTTMVSGIPGRFRFRVRDLDRSESFSAGAEVTLDIDGSRNFTGYLTSVARQFFFPSDRSDGLAARALVLEGVDINILFRKRIVADYLGDPANVLLRTPYPAGTFDSDVVADLVANYLDLSGDSLDTSTLVEHVGTPNPDLEGRVAFGSYTWEAAMNVIIKLTGAIYYIDPDRKLILTDVDTPNAPMSLSDMPTEFISGDFPKDDNAAQYREMELSFDGGDRVNDAMVWGAGQGSDKMVFARVEDATSIDAHGRWQLGDFRQDIFRQASVDHRADSIVNGSALNHRGKKDDVHSVSVVTHVPGFRAAQKVTFMSHAWYFEEVIPIRRVDITFETPSDPRWRLTLSHNIDEPWNIFEWWLPPPIDIPPIRDGIFFPFPPLFDYVVIDSFDNRVLHDPFGIGWGFASGYPSLAWTATNGEVYNGNGWMQQPGEDTPSVGASLTGYSIYDFGVPWIGLWKFSSPYIGSTNVQMQVGTMNSGALPPIYCYVDIGGINAVAEYYLMVWIVDAGGGDVRLRAKQWLIWDAMPVGWDVDRTFTPPPPGFFYLTLNCDWVGPYAGLGGGVFRVDYVWQLDSPNLPATLPAVVFGWVTMVVTPETDHRTLILGAVFQARTVRLRIDGNLDSPTHYTEFPSIGHVVYNDDILVAGTIEVTFYALRSLV